jgi:hypothetical protein
LSAGPGLTASRQHDAEHRALADLAFHLEFATVARHDVLDDRQAEPGAAGLARATAVDAVEAFGQPWQMLAGDADAGVAHLEDCAAVRIALQPARRDAPPIGRVAHGIAQQIAHGAGEFVVDARHLEPRLRIELHLMAPCRQQFGLTEHARHQRLRGDPSIGRWARAAFELGQRQQIVDQRLDAISLLTHQGQHPRLLGCRQRHTGQRVDEARQHRQRRANLVRDVGDEVASHRLQALAVGDVLRQQQFLTVAVGPHHDLDGRAPARAGNLHRRVERPFLQAPHERRCAQQVGHRLLQVASGIESEMVCSAGIAPVDTLLRIEQQDTVGRRVDRAQEVLQTIVLRRRSLLAQAQRSFDAVARFTPKSTFTRGVLVTVQPLLCTTQPAQQAQAAQ